ncbi:uncharacterized protein LOC129218883 [Uloborus diversus]|uniref:uncharacterized protein LOC129218883 n=1 Tax=Uloborus diversus TaxID=327109 RepID=UPI00240A6EF9|nr:uncharacterized protein LOC129218883 [Uloborus diversus]
MIGVLKKLPRRVLVRSSLTYEEMITVLCDCESTINSRPLTYMPGDDAELLSLSPNLFLQDIKTSGVPDIDALDHQSLNKRIKYRQNVQRDLRQRFRAGYLGALIQRSKHKSKLNISVGDIVLVGSDNMKRINWPLGKVIEVIPSKEEVVRLVKLQTAHGQILRPVQRLYPLEISSSDPIVQKSGQFARNPAPETVVPDDNISESRKTRSGRTVRIPQRLCL